MDLQQRGNLLKDLRKKKNMTQKEVAEKIGVVPKTVSKWETGHGFPDVSLLPTLADVFGINERILLTGNLIRNRENTGNMKRIRFFVCPNCGSIMFGMGECEISCCGKTLTALTSKQGDEEHAVKITEVEDEFYVELNHEMSKKHFISFIAVIKYDRVLTVRLYPEQEGAVRLPKFYGGKMVYYCSTHGLYEYNFPLNKR